VVAEAAVVVPVIPVMAEQVLRLPLLEMHRGLEHLVRVTEPTEVARAIVVSAQLALTTGALFPLIPAVT
jgi:hypothetical protein